MNLRYPRYTELTILALATILVAGVASVPGVGIMMV